MLGLGHEEGVTLPQPLGPESNLILNEKIIRILVTGSRDWWDRKSVWDPLGHTLARYGRVLVIHGDCPGGADLFTRQWAEAHRDQGADQDPHPADWAKHNKKAGPIRNGEMVEEGADMALVFANPCRTRKPWCPPGVHPSHGTADCVEKARAADIPVYFCPKGLSW
jgi:hypothetical protein